RQAQGLAATLRFRVPRGERVTFEDFVHGPQSFPTDDIGDFVVRRADGSAAFFFSNAVDDASMGVTQALRGEDHLTNTPLQLLVWQKDAVHALSPQAARAWLAPLLPAGLDAHATEAFIAALLPNVVLPEDARPWVDIVFGGPPPLGAAGEQVVREAGAGYFAAAAAAAAASGNDLPAIAGAVRAATGRKGAALYMPLRVALPRRAHGAELAPPLKAMPAGKARER